MPFQHRKRNVTFITLFPCLLSINKVIRREATEPESLSVKCVLKQWRDPGKIKRWDVKCSFLHFHFPFAIFLSFQLLFLCAHIFSRRKEWSQRMCCICCCCPRGLCHHPVWCRLHRQRLDAESHCLRRSHSSDQHLERSRWLAPTREREKERENEQGASVIENNVFLTHLVKVLLVSKLQTSMVARCCNYSI